MTTGYIRDIQIKSEQGHGTACDPTLAALRTAKLPGALAGYRIPEVVFTQALFGDNKGRRRVCPYPGLEKRRE
jgi:hypothetical protein